MKGKTKKLQYSKDKNFKSGVKKVTVNKKRYSKYHNKRIKVKEYLLCTHGVL